MKNRKLVPCLLLTVLLAACSAEIVSTLPEADVPTLSSNVEILERNSATTTISFEAVPYAKSYWFTLTPNGGEEGSFTSCGVATDSDGDTLTFVVDTSSVTDGEIKLYSSTSPDSAENPALFASVVLSSSDLEITDAYISERTASGAQIRFENVIDENSGLRFMVDYDISDDVPGVEYAASNVLNISLPEADASYEVYLYWASDGEEFKKYLVLSVGPYNGIDSQMSLEIENNIFVVSGIPSGVDTVELRKQVDDASGYKTLLTASTSNGSASFKASDLASLESGDFYVSTGSGVISNTIRFTAPVKVVSTSANWKSVNINIDFADDFDPDENELSIVGQSGMSASYSNNGILVTGLKSNTVYPSISVRVDNNPHLDFEVENIATKSFVGTYSWAGTVTATIGGSKETSFIIDVDNSESGSEFPYYVYFNPNDPAIASEENNEKVFRIMPLVDPGIENLSIKDVTIYWDNPPAGYEKANNAYKANASKWNGLKDTNPLFWSFGPVSITNDRVVTIINSNAGVDVTTETAFSFMEFDTDEDGIMEPIVKFKNKGNGLAALGVYRNADAAESPYQALDPDKTDQANCWYLTFVPGEV